MIETKKSLWFVGVNHKSILYNLHIITFAVNTVELEYMSHTKKSNSVL